MEMGQLWFCCGEETIWLSFFIRKSLESPKFLCGGSHEFWGKPYVSSHLRLSWWWRRRARLVSVTVVTVVVVVSVYLSACPLLPVVASTVTICVVCVICVIFVFASILEDTLSAYRALQERLL
jgi:hypothetical protein